MHFMRHAQPKQNTTENRVCIALDYERKLFVIKYALKSRIKTYRTIMYKEKNNTIRTVCVSYVTCYLHVITIRVVRRDRFLFISCLFGTFCFCLALSAFRDLVALRTDDDRG